MNSTAATPTPIVIVGAGGHGRVLLETLREAGHQILAFSDPRPELQGVTLRGVPVVGDDAALFDTYPPGQVLLALGLGSTADCTARAEVFARLRERGYRFATVIHPSVLIANEVRLGEGVQVMAAAVIQASAQLGDNVLVNTGAIIEHDCRIGEHVHVASGAVIAGNVSIGAATHVGCGATVIQGIRIGPHALVAAGAVVVRDVERDTRVAGVPAREKGEART